MAVTFGAAGLAGGSSTTLNVTTSSSGMVANTTIAIIVAATAGGEPVSFSSNTPGFAQKKKPKWWITKL